MYDTIIHVPFAVFTQKDEHANGCGFPLASDRAALLFSFSRFLRKSAKKARIFGDSLTFSGLACKTAVMRRETAAEPLTHSRLDNAECQAVLRRNIGKTGKVAHCYDGICSERQFMRWKKARRKEWQAILSAGMADFRLKLELTNPDIVSECTQQLLEKIRERALSARELKDVLEFFYKLRNSL